MEVKDKKFTILGLARSGMSAAKKLLNSGALVKISDSRSREKVEEKVRLTDIEDQTRAYFEFGGHTEQFCLDTDVVVVSPGVHLDIPVIEKALSLGIPVISEVELAFSFFKKPVIAITGTNGKTTTTTLIGEILKNARLRVDVGGNIGKPLVEIEDNDLDFIVAEISSYQLETIKDFRPFISVLLNITEDHLERYKTMGPYIEAKKRIFMSQTRDDHAVYNYDDLTVREAVKDVMPSKVPFSRKTALQNGVFINDGHIVRLRENIIESVIPADDIRIKGDHNIENALAATAVCLLCGVPAEDIAATLRKFPGVEHRIEHVAYIGDVEFINDSKGTNPDSTIVALRTVAKGDTVVILGGRDKGGDISEMSRTVKDLAKGAVLIGEAAERFSAALKAAGVDNIGNANDMKEAVSLSLSMTGGAGKVLLSPACASFDMFSDYEHRGRVFKDVVKEMTDGTR